MDTKNPRMETNGDNEKYGKNLKKMGGPHKNNGSQRMDEIGERQKEKDRNNQKRPTFGKGWINVGKEEKKYVS